MKKHINILILSALVLLAACNNNNNSSVSDTIKLTCNINTFDAPISCISPSPTDNNKLYIGKEDGCFIEKVNNNCTTYSINSNRRIYDILECNPDSLFIGTRDAGLKLFTDATRPTQSYYIRNKNLNYSVYSLAKDEANQRLYIGTSNGLYLLDLKDKSDSRELMPVQLGKGRRNYAINKVMVKDHTLYIASDLGLFIVQNPATDFSRPVIDSLTTNLSIYNDTVYALLENSIIKVAPDKTKTLLREGSFYMYAQSPAQNPAHGSDKGEWFITGNSILYTKGQETLAYDMPGQVSTNAKQIGVMGKDFFYLACKEELLSFPLRQNSSIAENNVIAVSDKKTGDTIHFITDDLRMHQYRFIYNHPEFKSKSLGKIKGLDISGNEVVKFLETEKNTFYLATRKKLYKIKNNKATRLLRFSDSKGQDNISVLYYSPVEHRLYIGTRRYLGIVDEQAERIVTPIPIVSDKGVKDSVDAYITGICENGDSMYVSTLNKGLYGKPLKADRAPLRQLRDLSEYESTYGLIASGKNIYLNTSKGIVNDKNATFLPVKHAKTICGVLEKNPNEGFFILHYYGLSFKAPDSPGISAPLFSDLSFDGHCIAINGRKAVLGCKSGLFLYDGKAELASISIGKEKFPYLIYIVGAAILLILAFALLFLLKRRKLVAPEAEKDEKRIIPDEQETDMEDVERELQDVGKKVKTLFDTLGIKKVEGEDRMRQDLKQTCLHFADRHPELGRISCMKRRGKERYFITILLFIEDIDANIISRVLDVDQSTVTRHKYNLRKEIEQLYPAGEPDDKLLGLLYERISAKRK